MQKYALLNSLIILLATASLPASSQDSSVVSGCFLLAGNFDTGGDVCTEFQFSNATTNISAGEATTQERNFDDNEWLFEKGLTIEFRTVKVTAQSGRIYFRDGEMSLFELSGSPAELTVLIEDRNLTVSGTAPSISYQAADETLRLLGQVQFVIGDNNNRTTACDLVDLVYNLSDNSYTAGDTECRGARAESSIPGSDPGSESESDSQ